jgi:hypothetical protein
MDMLGNAQSHSACLQFVMLSNAKHPRTVFLALLAMTNKVCRNICVLPYNDRKKGLGMTGKGRSE